MEFHALKVIKKDKRDINRYLKEILKYIVIFVGTTAFLLLLLVLTALIPKDAIKNNLIESADFLKNKKGIEEHVEKRDYGLIHYYADSVILNIINGIDSSKPLKSVMWSNYYETILADVNIDFIKAVNENKEPNQQYIRYWHGSMVVLRPLLLIFNLEQLYLINKVFLFALSIMLFILLFIKNKKLSIVYLLSLIMIVFRIVPMCFEYTWTFYIMFATSIISILIEKKGDKYLYTLFFITGIITCFFDFLTTEIITVFVPLLFVLWIRKEENRIANFKECFILVLKISIFWTVAYILMWFTKWFLASVILNINALDYVKEKAFIRINGLSKFQTKKELYSDSLYRNFHTLYPLNAIEKISYIWTCIGVLLTIIIINIDWKNIKKKWLSLMILLIGITPYIRYLILANHSYRHSFFTFRDQMITIIALCIIVFDCFNKDLWFKIIKLSRGRIWKKS